MRNRLVFAGAAVLAAMSPARAHDFWLEPEKFEAMPGEAIAVYFTIGHAGEHEAWNLRREKVAALKSCLGAQCLPQPPVIPNSPEQRGRAIVSLEAAGTHVLAFESRHSLSELDGAAFTDYAQKEGLTAILEDRAARNVTGAPGRELYSRRAKALIRVGTADPGDVSAAVGHTLEIIPDKNPYALKAGERLPVRVLFNGAPLAGVTIDFDDLSDRQDPLQSAATDGQGAASFAIEGKGPFKLMAIWGKPISDRSEADYETIFASLTFGS